MSPLQILTELISSSGITDFSSNKATENKAFTNKFKPEIDKLIASCLLGHRPHKLNSSYFDLGKASERRKTFKQFGKNDCFDYFNSKIGIFIEAMGHKQNSHNKAWALNGEFKRAIDTLLPIAGSMKLSNFHQMAVTKPKHDTVSYITPDYSAMQAYFQSSMNTTADRLVMWAYMVSFQLHGGQIPQYYRKGKNNGLYYPVGALSITNKKRELRNTIMSKYIQYDLGAAAFSILYNLSNNKLNYPTLKLFIDDPKGFRQTVAAKSNLTYQEVKLCFISVAFGGVLSAYGKIAQEVDTTKLKRFVAEADYKSFKKELTKLRREICDQKPFITEQVKKEHPRRYRTKASARIYQSHLNDIVDSIAELSATPNDSLYVYDAIFLKDDLKESDIESNITNQTGFVIKVSKE
ncbi:hypothetical protein EK599_19950 [Vibrio sp. T187]|uniref:hypothetical protein n=1 Tax=Vibrio TaxID=662 RepID=UPI0010C9CE90|nr:MULTISPECIES: hypothetical protein [Vibrio]MBW3697960.1 hypothetical protein [Vibrio sp. T187]